jgi:hypothetical protein
LERLFAAEEFESHDVKCINNTLGHFSVQSKSQQKLWFDVKFGDDNNMPKCDCPDWKKWCLPCKHFLAVFRNYDNWKWENLSSLYKSSPFLSLDESLINELQSPKQVSSFDDIKTNEPNTEEVFFEDQETEAATSDTKSKPLIPLPKPKSHHRSEATKCRDLLAQLKSASYLVYQEEALIALKGDLLDALSAFKKHMTKENGLDLEKPLESTTTTGSNCPDINFHDFPPPSKKKQKYSGRVGITANDNRLLTGVKTEIDKIIEGPKTLPVESIPYQYMYEDFQDSDEETPEKQLRVDQDLDNQEG